MQSITFKGKPGFITGKAKSPGIIVIQEWWGVTDIIKGHAQMLAHQGYRCLVPDLYKGKVGVDKEEASHLMGNLDFQVAVEELKDAVSYLKEEGSEHVGCVGFCMGGALAIAAAQHCDIQAGAPFYGLPNPQIAQPENIKIPLLMSYGELDITKGFSDPESAKAFYDKVQAAGGQAELHIYPGCGHSFFNVGEKATETRKYMDYAEPPKEQQELAKERLLAFFEKHLKQ